MSPIDALGVPDDAPERYAIEDVAPIGGPASRFDGKTTPAGWDAPKGLATANAWLTLADKAAREAPSIEVTTRRVRMMRLAKIAGRDDYALIPRGTIDAVPSLRPETPQRIGKVETIGGATIDAFLAREPDGPYFKLRDEAIWNALLEWARTAKPTPQAVRDASDAVGVAVAVRQGFPATAYALTHGGLVQPE
jgi:hypothetical protein